MGPVSAVAGRPAPRLAGVFPRRVARIQPLHLRREAQPRPAAELRAVIPGDALDRQLLPAKIRRIAPHHARPLPLGHLADAHPEAAQRYSEVVFLRIRRYFGGPRQQGDRAALPDLHQALSDPDQRHLRAARQHDRPFFVRLLPRRQGARPLRRRHQNTPRREKRDQGRDQPSAGAAHHGLSFFSSLSQYETASFDASSVKSLSEVCGSIHRRKPIFPGAGQTACG